MAEQLREQGGVSVSRIAAAVAEPRSSVGRWVRPGATVQVVAQQRARPVSGDDRLREQITELCERPRHERYGHRRIRALLRRDGRPISRKTAWRVMSELGLSQQRVWRRPARPRRVERMRPQAADHAWQIDMTSLALADLTPLFLVVVIDCFTRQIVGWTLDRRCRASEWSSAVRMALESRGLDSKQACGQLVLRSDNGAQPCSKHFVQFLGSRGVKGQFTGYDTPDDNAFVERVIRTIKEEEIWLNEYETFAEAHAAIESYVKHYNSRRIHSALGYRTPDDFAAANFTLAAA